MKLSSFIIAMILMVFVVTSIIFLMGDFNAAYPRDDYDESELESFNRMQELTNLTEEINAQTNITADANLFDTVGFYLSAGYKASKASTQGIVIFTGIATDAAEKSGIKHAGYIATTLITVLILIIVFLVIRIMVKTDV